MSRAWSFALASALSFVGVGGACSSFTETDPGATPDADADADAETDADVGADAPIGEGGPDAPNTMPTIVATSDTSTIVDVRLDDTRVLWTTSTGAPWDLTSTSGLYAASASGTMQTVGSAGVMSFFAGPAHLGSLSGDGTAGSAWVSEISATAGLLESIIATGFSVTPLTVGPLTIRLVESNHVLYWLSRDGQTTVLSSTGTGDTDTLKSLEDDTASDLAIEETPGGPIVFVTFATGIYGARVAGGGDLTSVVPDNSVVSITASRTGLYWTNVLGDVTYCAVDYAGSDPLNCVAPTKVLSVRPNDTVVNVRFDHDRLFAATTFGSIYECDGTMCPSTPLVQRAPLFDGDEYRYGHTMAASDSELFWSEGGPKTPHRIMRIAR